MPKTVEIPAKSPKLQKMEQEAREATETWNAWRAESVDPSGAEILRPELARRLREDSLRLSRDYESKTGRAAEQRREEGWSRADELLKSSAFRALLEAKVHQDSERMEVTAELLNAMQVAGRDAVKIFPKVYVVTADEVQDLKIFAHRVRAQRLDLKVLTPAVREWVESNS